MTFDIHPQSGVLQPNGFPGLIMWLDASEAGTLSRVGTTLRYICDKAPGGYELLTRDKTNRPKILQSRFNGKTVLRFERPPQFLIGTPNGKLCCCLTVIAVVDGKLIADCKDCVTVTSEGIVIPSLDYEGPIEIAEMLIYDQSCVTIEMLEWLNVYLKNKWQL